MPFNGPIDGDWTNVDFKKPGWVSGVMELTHEEVLYVQEQTQVIIDAFIVENGYEPPSNEYVLPEYNKQDWEKCINGDTYAVIKSYDSLVHTLGIDANGIVQPESTEELDTESVE
ncbi:hypothetical protein [Bacillus sp. MRMR6]|uniref:hypothetical protein n=1 Tax=Bacillus sp. MRMR6 TaxID=1928617 RepID=UPI000951F86C|nr:hypothetical protein [Bacillus sp. MRMR6]OLS39146.1 hypothetical protein BTR25_13520 [Bacillus sp. MRMR6]